MDVLRGARKSTPTIFTMCGTHIDDGLIHYVDDGRIDDDLLHEVRPPDNKFQDLQHDLPDLPQNTPHLASPQTEARLRVGAASPTTNPTRSSNLRWSDRSGNLCLKVKLEDSTTRKAANKDLRLLDA